MLFRSRRIQTLEAQRIPDPAAFAAGLRTEADALGEQARAVIARLGLARVEADTEALRLALRAELDALGDRAAVQAWTQALARRLPAEIETRRVDWAAELTREAAEVASAIEARALSVFEERYRLAEAAIGTPAPSASLTRAPGEIGRAHV